MNINDAAERAIRARTNQDILASRQGLPLMADHASGDLAFRARYFLRLAASGDYASWEELAALALAGMVSADRVEQAQPHTGDAA